MGESGRTDINYLGSLIARLSVITRKSIDRRELYIVYVVSRVAQESQMSAALRERGAAKKIQSKCP